MLKGGATYHGLGPKSRQVEVAEHIRDHDRSTVGWLMSFGLAMLWTRKCMRRAQGRRAELSQMACSKQDANGPPKKIVRVRVVADHV